LSIDGRLVKTIASRRCFHCARCSPKRWRGNDDWISSGTNSAAPRAGISLELIVYDRVLDASELTSVQTYSAEKWTLSTLLGNVNRSGVVDISDINPFVHWHSDRRRISRGSRRQWKWRGRLLGHPSIYRSSNRSV